MNLPDPKRRDYTIKDWETWDGSWELIDGRAFPTHPAPPPPLAHSRAHVRLAASLYAAIDTVNRQNGCNWEVFTSPVYVFLGDKLSRSISRLLAEVDQNPTGIFWG